MPAGALIGAEQLALMSGRPTSVIWARALKKLGDCVDLESGEPTIEVTHVIDPCLKKCTVSGAWPRACHKNL